MSVSNSNDLADINPPFNAVFQMVNPRNDPWEDPWYTVMGGGPLVLGKPILSDTIDWYWNNIFFDGSTDFIIWYEFSSYSNAVNHIGGGGKDLGVYFVRGQIDIPNTDLFAYSVRNNWYKIRT